jgi:hypothetical protein
MFAKQTQALRVGRYYAGSSRGDYISGKTLLEIPAINPVLSCGEM